MNEKRRNERWRATPGRSSLITHRSSFRRAFTLVELMMSLIIIGLLTSMLGVAISFALNKAKQARISTEISNLDVALQSYKNQFGGEYPPCMAFGGTVPARIDLFNRAWRKHFPRCTLDYSGVAALLYNGNGTPANPTAWKVNSITQPGTLKTLDLNGSHSSLLDPAEALVFWLAGPPTPVDLSQSPPRPLASTVLFGFSSNVQNPLSMQGSRMPALFDFDETRLTDVDGDGWPEYVPQVTANKNLGGFTAAAPYVYFDQASYTCTVKVGANNVTLVATYPQGSWAPDNAWPITPIPLGNTSFPGPVLSEFGRAVPYPTLITAVTPSFAGVFWEPKKFQIICAGQDNEYGGSAYEPTPDLGSSGGQRPFMPLLPQMANQSSNGVNFPVLLTGERDNLTNFIDGKLEDYVPQ